MSPGHEVPAGLAAALDAVRDADQLHRWLPLFVTGSAAEIADRVLSGAAVHGEMKTRSNGR